MVTSKDNTKDLKKEIKRFFKEIKTILINYNYALSVLIFFQVVKTLKTDETRIEKPLLFLQYLHLLWKSSSKYSYSIQLQESFLIEKEN